MPLNFRWVFIFFGVIFSVTSGFSQIGKVQKDTSARLLPEVKTHNQGTQIVKYANTPENGMMELTSEDGKIVLMPETKPEFPGGSSALSDFIKANLRYPDEVIKKGRFGIVVVQFTIEADGTAHSPVITLDKVGYGAADEVKRLIQLMPKWKPATIQNNPVIVTYTQVINFRKRENQAPDLNKQN